VQVQHRPNPQQRHHHYPKRLGHDFAGLLVCLHQYALDDPDAPSQLQQPIAPQWKVLPHFHHHRCLRQNNDLKARLERNHLNNWKLEVLQ